MKKVLRYGPHVCCVIFMLEAGYAMLFNPEENAHLICLQTAILFALLAEKLPRQHKEKAHTQQ